MVSHRLMIDPPALGSWNMGVDEALLLDAIETGTATLRFYEWSEPTLSLGYFQNYSDRQQHAASRMCAVVRRQTGGGAILHDRELTYSVALPPTHPLSRQSQRLYSAVHEAFTATVREMITGSDATLRQVCCDQESSSSAVEEPFLCFERRTPGDVILQRNRTNQNADRPPVDWKILGSAQRRHRGAILQHGSMLLRKSPAAPELEGLCDLTGREITTHRLSGGLKTRLEETLGLPLIPGKLTHELQSKAQELANRKYGLPTWTKRR